jgi:hypothetical protein
VWSVRVVVLPVRVIIVVIEIKTVGIVIVGVRIIVVLVKILGIGRIIIIVRVLGIVVIGVTPAQDDGDKNADNKDKTKSAHAHVS